MDPFTGRESMGQTLIGAGIACIAAAIIGKGLKAFGFEIPAFSSLARQGLLAFFGAVLLVLGLLSKPEKPIELVPVNPPVSTTKEAQPTESSSKKGPAASTAEEVQQAETPSPKNPDAEGAVIATGKNSSATLTRENAVAFGAGIGPFKFGMTPQQVNALLPTPFGSVAWDTLPVANEFRGSEVRYFFVPLAQFPKSGAESGLYNALADFHDCWSGDSYIGWGFVDHRLIRMHVRLTADCRPRIELLRRFAENLGATYDGAGRITFQKTFKVQLPDTELLKEVTVLGHNDSNASQFDLYLTQSPQPDWLTSLLLR